MHLLFYKVRSIFSIIPCTIIDILGKVKWNKYLLSCSSCLVISTSVALFLWRKLKIAFFSERKDIAKLFTPFLYCLRRLKGQRILKKPSLSCSWVYLLFLLGVGICANHNFLFKMNKLSTESVE